jgi:D-3-phosphoglycerate dehydrogenase
MKDLYISTSSFANINKDSLDLLNRNNITFDINQSGKKIVPSDASYEYKNCKYLIAGTEDLSEVIINNPNLKFICRLGLGIENVPISLLNQKKIKLSFTPATVSKTVAEMTLGLMLNLLRRISFFDRDMKKDIWKKKMGKSLDEVVIGIVGYGRIGQEVKKLIEKLSVKKILLHDTSEAILKLKDKDKALNFCGLKELLIRSDIITLHLPLTKDTDGLIGKNELSMMKDDAILINCSRGGLINENELYNHMSNHKTFCAALDTFETEPYDGILKSLNNIILTPHVSSSTVHCRNMMEMSAVNETINFHLGKPLKNEIIS